MSVQPEGEPDMWALVEKSGACQSSCQDRSRDHFQPVLGGFVKYREIAHIIYKLGNIQEVLIEYPKNDVDSQMLILPQICIYWRRNFDAEMVFAQSERGVRHRELLTHHPRYKKSHLFKYLSDVATKYIETILNKLVLAIYTIWLNIDNITTQCMATLGRASEELNGWIGSGAIREKMWAKPTSATSPSLFLYNHPTPPSTKPIQPPTRTQLEWFCWPNDCQIKIFVMITIFS